jgi:hypothetical protein
MNVLEQALEALDATIDYIPDGTVQGDRDSGLAFNAITALKKAIANDTLKKQWQREALVNIAVAVKEMGVFNYSVESIVEEIYNRAKELE